jgi:hypothetical protein
MDDAICMPDARPDAELCRTDRNFGRSEAD